MIFNKNPAHPQGFFIYVYIDKIGKSVYYKLQIKPYIISNKKHIMEKHEILELIRKKGKKMTQDELLKISALMIDSEITEAAVRTKTLNPERTLEAIKNFTRSQDMWTAVAESIQWKNLNAESMIEFGVSCSKITWPEDHHHYAVWKEIIKRLPADKLSIDQLFQIEKYYSVPAELWDKAFGKGKIERKEKKKEVPAMAN